MAIAATTVITIRLRFADAALQIVSEGPGPLETRTLETAR
jgi:hypothetical protein